MGGCASFHVTPLPRPLACAFSSTSRYSVANFGISRSASRSPHRTANDHRSVSTPMSPQGDPPAAVSGSTASASAGNFGARSAPSEEARNYVGRSVTASQQAAAQQNSTKGSSPRTGASPGQKQSSTLAPPQTPASSQQPQSQSSGAGGSSRRRQYRQVGDWVLQKTLGQGSMGKVKLGVNVNTHERVSLREHGTIGPGADMFPSAL